MPADIDLKNNIQTALSNFENKALAEAARGLLNTLGYHSNKTLAIAPNTPAQFQTLFDPQKKMKDKARLTEWQSVDLLFQVTSNELGDALSRQGQRFANQKVNDALIESYLFFAIELTGEQYSRRDLADITREVNKCFPMPALVIFKYGEMLTFSIIARRSSKRDESKDVLEKVTLIKDIRLAENRAHVEILHDLALPQLAQKHSIHHFVDLQRAWEKALDTNELNKSFYREIAHWYFWAVKNVTFPKDAGADEATRNATSVIRLITRLIFVWFIKEKGLVSEDLFDKHRLDEMLNYSDPKESTYYKAILQNLFFATLNIPMEDRRFRSEREYHGKNKDNGNSEVFRYQSLFQEKVKFEALFLNIPFLNGGLFECLDNKGESVRIDGFSDHKDNPLRVPDYLFFGDEREFNNLNEILGTNNKKYNVRGLIHIFNRYKFTIEENTPIEEEIALDPELLGKVFENLLAAYNPETGTTARKQTGSFYTPREIVNYMVDEALVAYFETALAVDGAENGLPSTAHGCLRDLLAYNNKGNEFTPAETARLIAAIDNLKVLDPAAGSGAFPMGVLHKLVFILSKLDHDNSGWRELQRQKAIQETEYAYQIGNHEERRKRLLDIEETFDNNASDYGRKLYLVENCIYGVDIQPIAVQIAKLRFFISLVVEQKTNAQKENLGIRPLPNLETKFVAANTLIGLDEPEVKENTAISFGDHLIRDKRAELKAVRHKIFADRTPKAKREHRELDKKLRAEIAELLKQDWGKQAAQQMAGWDPYNQNAHADFFDPEWMFGIEGGFDVVIGNPPYVGERGHKDIFRDISQNSWGKTYYQRKMDLFYFFFHIALDLLKSNGCTVFITTNYFITADGAKNLRIDLKARSSILKLINFNEVNIFDSAPGQHNMITILQKTRRDEIICESSTTQRSGWVDSTVLQSIMGGVDNQTDYQRVSQSNLFEGGNSYIRPSGNIKDSSDPTQIILQKLQDNSKPLGIICKVNQGILTGVDKIKDSHLQSFPENQFQKGDGVYVLTTKERSNLKDNPTLFKPWFKNSDIHQYFTNNVPEDYVIYATRDLDLNKASTVYHHFLKFEKAIKARNQDRGEMQAALKQNKWWVIFAARKNIDFEGYKIVAPQRSYINTFGFNETSWYASADVYYITRKQTNISLKYILALLNSKLYYIWLYYKGKRKGEMLELYQKPLSEIPIKIISQDNQKPFIVLVERILAAKRANPAADTKDLEREIDRLVYDLYGLTQEERDIVEGKL